MSKLIAELREGHSCSGSPDCVACRAAAELERLTAELEQARNGFHQGVAKIMAERDRLLRQDEVHWKTRRSLLKEIEQLKQQLETAALDRAIGADAQENDRLRAGLERYGKHAPGCNVIYKRQDPTDCTCGFREALAGDKP